MGMGTAAAGVVALELEPELKSELEPKGEPSWGHVTVLVFGVGTSPVEPPATCGGALALPP